jgi:hypothetical protein
LSVALYRFIIIIVRDYFLRGVPEDVVEGNLADRKLDIITIKPSPPEFLFSTTCHLWNRSCLRKGSRKRFGAFAILRGL